MTTMLTLCYLLDTVQWQIDPVFLLLCDVVVDGDELVLDAGHEAGVAKQQGMGEGVVQGGHTDAAAGTALPGVQVLCPVAQLQIRVIWLFASGAKISG